MIQKSCLLSIFLFCCGMSFAQFSPVNWSHKAENIQSNEYLITFTAEIENGWYVYSQFLKDGGPIPTSFTFITTEGLEFIGKVKEEGAHKKENFDKLFEMNLIKYAEKVVFTQKVKVSGEIKSVKGYLTFMTCNDESCLPPKDIDFEINLN